MLFLQSSTVGVVIVDRLAVIYIYTRHSLWFYDLVSTILVHCIMVHIRIRINSQDTDHIDRVIV